SDITRLWGIARRHARIVRDSAVRRVAEQDDPGIGRRDVEQAQRAPRSVAVEQPLARTEEQRVDHDQVLVDEIEPRELANQLSAAEHCNRPAGLGLESTYGIGEIAAQQRRA